MELFLDETICKKNLEPLTLTRHTADIRIGIQTIRQKWQLLCGKDITIITENPGENSVHIPANLIPDTKYFKSLLSFYADHPISDIPEFGIFINYPWDIIKLNQPELTADFGWLCRGRQSEKIDPTNQTINSDQIFIEPGAVVRLSLLNAENGPIYIGKNALVMEGAMIRGPFALLDDAVVKMGAKIYAATTIGVGCTAGGEIKNSILFDYSNKAHDGYLGDSVIGSWCNIGAGSSNSNVKNTGGEVSFLNDKGEHLPAGTKAGLVMGDYSRCAINTSFNTGTSVGVCCNLFGQTTVKKIVAHFSWGNEIYQFDKAIRDIDNWKQMKHLRITEAEIENLKTIYRNHTNK